MNLHTEAKARLSLPTPPFFKKVQARAAKTSAAFLALTTLLASLATLLPATTVFTALAVGTGVATAFFGGVAALCTLVVDNPAEIPAAAAAVATLATQQEAPAEEPAGAGLAPPQE